MYNSTPPCIVPNCPEYSIEKSRCSEHQLPAFQSGRRERLPKDWNWRRSETFKTYGTVCHACGEEGADAIDHVIPGDDHSLTNLRPIHHWNENSRGVQCHFVKTSREGNTAKRNKGLTATAEYWVREYHRRQANGE